MDTALHSRWYNLSIEIVNDNRPWNIHDIAMEELDGAQTLMKNRKAAGTDINL